MSQVKELDVTSLPTGNAVVKVYGKTCSPCKALAPEFEQVAEQVQDVEFYSVCLEDNLEWVKSVKVRSVPTLLFYKDGEIVQTVTGFKPASVISELISTHLA